MRIEIECARVQVQVTAAGENMAVVSVRYSRGRDAIAKVCRELEPLRLRVVTGSITAAGDTVVQTMFVEVSTTVLALHPWSSPIIAWLPRLHSDRLQLHASVSF